MIHLAANFIAVNFKQQRNFFLEWKKYSQRRKTLRDIKDPSDSGRPENVKLFRSFPITGE